MADTQLEGLMDDYVAKNIRIEHYIQYLDARSGKWKNVHGDLDENTKYKLYVCARNIGSETFVKNVGVRVVNGNPGRIRFYKDDTYTAEVGRLDSPVHSGVLKPTDGTNPGQATPWHMVPFMVKEGTDQYAPIASTGLYAEIVPQGHTWSGIYEHLD